MVDMSKLADMFLCTVITREGTSNLSSFWVAAKSYQDALSRAEELAMQAFDGEQGNLIVTRLSDLCSGTAWSAACKLEREQRDKQVNSILEELGY